MLEYIRVFSKKNNLGVNRLTGRPTFMWKTVDPDTSEKATPKHVRTCRPKT